MPNYNKSCVYKLCCKDPKIKEEYIGSTTNFGRRKCSHKTSCNNEKYKNYNLLVYKYIRDHGGWNNWDMVVIENVNVDTKHELHTIERQFIEELDASLNKVIPTRQMKEYCAEYYQKNKEKINK